VGETGGFCCLWCILGIPAAFNGQEGCSLPWVVLVVLLAGVAAAELNTSSWPCTTIKHWNRIFVFLSYYFCVVDLSVSPSCLLHALCASFSWYIELVPHNNLTLVQIEQVGVLFLYFTAAAAAAARCGSSVSSWTGSDLQHHVLSVLCLMLLLPAAAELWLFPMCTVRKGCSIWTNPAGFEQIEQWACLAVHIDRGQHSCWPQHSILKGFSE
jgi:hypothetical protein